MSLSQGNDHIVLIRAGGNAMRMFTSGVAALLLTATGASAAISVTNYNWLQLKPNDVTPFTNPAGGNGYGTPDFFRWGDHAWIPNGTKTQSGAGDYYAGLQLDRARNVKKVNVQWWANEGTAIQKVYIQGSTDGVSYTDIGNQDFGSLQTGQRFFSNVNVTPGNYKYIRAVVKTGDYSYGNGSRGGPGIYAIEPYGDDTVYDNQVNWANKPNFSTTTLNNDLFFNGLRYNDGDLYDDEGTRTGARSGDAGPWAPYDGVGLDSWAQINLNGVRNIDSVVSVYDFGWTSTSYKIWTSLDGVTFTQVTGKSAPTQYAGGPGATGYTFDPTLARYVRVSDYANTASYQLLNQVIVYGIPEPTTASLLGVVGMGLMARRKRA